VATTGSGGGCSFIGFSAEQSGRRGCDTASPGADRRFPEIEVLKEARIMKDIHLPDFTRRVFLNRSLQALGAAATVPLATAWLAETSAAADQPGKAPLAFLTPGEYATLDALGDALIPAGGAFEPGARDVDLARRIDSYLPKMDPGVAAGFRGALAFVEQEAPGLAGKKPPFSALSQADRGEVLTAMLQDGGLARGVFTATKYVCVAHFYTIDETWKFTGYDGPMLLEGAQ
jgi:hypothetical protein